MRVGTSFILSNTPQRLVPEEGQGNASIGNMFAIRPTLPVYNPYGTFYELGGTTENPVKFLLERKIENNHLYIGNNAFVEAEILNVLLWKTTFSFSLINFTENYYRPITATIAGQQLKGQGTSRLLKDYMWNVDNTLSYVKIKELLAQQQQDSIKILEKDQNLQASQLAQEQTIRQYGRAALALLLVVIAVILYSYWQNRRKNLIIHLSR